MGRQPSNGDLVFDKAGNLYGVAGAFFPTFTVNGVIYRLTPNPGGIWTIEILYGPAYTG